LKLIRIAALALAVGGVLGAGSAHAATTYKHFSSSPLHFSIDYPAAWRPEYSATDQYESFNQSKQVALTVNYFKSDGKMTVKSLTAALMKVFKKDGVNVGSASYSGNSGGFSGSGKISGYNEHLAVLAVVTPKGGFGLEMAAPPSQWSTFKLMFNHMASSFTAK